MPEKKFAQDTADIILAHMQSAGEPTQIYKKERRSRHLQLLVTPSTYDKLAKLAKKYDCSVNEICNQLLAKAGEI